MIPVDYWAVLLAALFTIVLGFLWYGPFFGRPWMRLAGVTAESIGAEYRDLDSRRRSLLLRGLAFLHLKKDLDVQPIDWVDCADPHEASEDYEETRPARMRGPLTGYGMPKRVQEKLAGIRTDLDSFSEIEAFSLMLSGYRMMTHEFSDQLGHIPVSETKFGDFST